MAMDKILDVSVEHTTQRVYFAKMGFYFVLHIVQLEENHRNGKKQAWIVVMGSCCRIGVEL